MDSITLAEQFIQQGPTLGAFVFLVVIFIGYLRHRDDVLKEISGACHEVQGRAIVSQDKATEAIVENSRVLGASHEVLVEVKKLLIRKNGNRP